jgi:arginase
VHSCLSAGDFPLVIGGDHSCAIGTWSGVGAALKQGENKDARLGLIWFDAHMDAHTPATSPSQALHGMPLACLLGYGDAHLTDLMDHGVGEKHRPVLRPEDVCLIGVRSFEWGEAALLHQLGVRVYFMAEVRERGLPEIVREALLRVRRETDGFGVSIDLDVLEPAEEPGVGSPVPGGIALHDMLEALAWVRATSGLKALEIVEYNPYSDHHFDTAAAVADLARTIVGTNNAR